MQIKAKQDTLDKGIWPPVRCQTCCCSFQSKVSIYSTGCAAIHFKSSWLAPAWNVFPHTAGTKMRHWQIQVYGSKRSKNMTGRKRPTPEIFLIQLFFLFPSHNINSLGLLRGFHHWESKKLQSELASLQYALFIWLTCHGMPFMDYLCRKNPHMLGFLIPSCKRCPLEMSTHQKMLQTISLSAKAYFYSLKY